MLFRSASDLQEKVRRFKEMAAKAEVERNQIKETQSKLSRAKKIKKELLSIPSKKMQPAVATTLKTKPSGTLTQKNNSLVSAQSSVKLKKMPIPGKKNLVSPKKTGATAGLQNVSKPSGSAKDQSFYKQRDRLALFYSSLKAETLAMEIQSQFKKLQKNKTAWTHYYGQWRKKVRSSLAQDIRTFPSRSKTYAYPQLMASFKRDYELFYKYGETFDLKVRGVRIPSDSPRDMKSVFTKYRRQALGLGH